MPAVLRLAFALPLALTPGLLACESQTGADDPALADDGQDEHETHGDSSCVEEDRADEFMVGLAKSGASVTVSFVSADPAPPVRGDNTWVVAVSDASGPLADAQISEVTPFMPDHGHGTAVSAVVSATDSPGEFEIAPINLYMVGLWEVTLAIDVGDGTHDEVMFAFCVE
jgi:hypothetical protein